MIFHLTSKKKGGISTHERDFPSRKCAKCAPKQESEHTYANMMEVSESRICRQDLQIGSSVMNEDVLVFYVAIQRSNLTQVCSLGAP